MNEKHKYPLNIFKAYKIPYSWNTIKIGLDLNIINLSSINDFALQYLQENPGLVNEYISDLIVDKKLDEREYDQSLRKLFESLKLDYPLANSTTWNKEWRKWRYCILKFLIDSSQNDRELLDNVESLYADLSYPADMKSFIYYIPNSSTEGLPPTFAQKKLIENLNDFLKEERKKIDEGVDFLPKRINSQE